jgi:hypothetical protein
MTILGVLIGIGAAIGFLLLGALTLFGGTDATRQQILPGFRPDRTGANERILILLSFWGPVAIVSLFCLLAGIQIVRVAVAALIP